MAEKTLMECTKELLKEDEKIVSTSGFTVIRENENGENVIVTTGSVPEIYDKLKDR